MTPLQESIKNIGPWETIRKYSLITYESKEFPDLIGLYYNQIESCLTNDVVKWSRGTVFNKKTWELVAQSFPRFAAYGKDPLVDSKFDWSDTVCNVKEDGSLIILFYWNGQWIVKNSHAFNANTANGTLFSDLFWVEYNKFNCLSDLNKNITYLFEICTLDNKVVRFYHEPKLFLLGAFYGTQELSHSNVSQLLSVPRPETWQFKSFEEVDTTLKLKAIEDPSFEWFVLRDKRDRRIKFKSNSYYALHHMHDNGNIYLKKNILKLICSLSNQKELFKNYPDIIDRYNDVYSKVLNIQIEVSDLWYKLKHIKNKKEFVEKIKNSRYFHILIKLFDNQAHGHHKSFVNILYSFEKTLLGWI